MWGVQVSDRTNSTDAAMGKSKESSSSTREKGLKNVFAPIFSCLFVALGASFYAIHQFFYVTLFEDVDAEFGLESCTHKNNKSDQDPTEMTK